jgi:hypothetical protein
LLFHPSQCDSLFVYVFIQQPERQLSSKHEEKEETSKHIDTNKRQRTKHSNLCHLDSKKNFASAFAPTVMRGEKKIYAYIILDTINILINKKALDNI